MEAGDLDVAGEFCRLVQLIRNHRRLERVLHEPEAHLAAMRAEHDGLAEPFYFQGPLARVLGEVTNLEARFGDADTGVGEHVLPSFLVVGERAAPG